MELNTTLAGKTFVFGSIKEVLAKANEEKSGDVLAGVIASLAAQGVTPLKAACIGAYVHGRAADEMVSELGVRGLLPHDLPAQIGRLLG